LQIDPVDEPLPPRVAEFLREADQRIDRFRFDRVIPGFVPSDFVGVYGVLAALVRGRVAPGRAFCEWGSGFGVVTCLASMLGYDARGIEIETELVECARKLADDFTVPVQFAEGSFILDDEDELPEADSISWTRFDGSNAYEELGLDPEDFDVIFAYPWPGEERRLRALFENHAANGAVLVSYHGQEGIRVARKVAGRRRR
jgi:hypothetical protein